MADGNARAKIRRSKPSGFAVGEKPLQHAGHMQDAVVGDPRSCGKANRHVPEGPNAATVMEADDLNVLLKNEIVDSGGCHLKDSFPGDKRDRLYVLGSAVEWGPWLP